MNILFAGGGTAGHVNPAIALAQEFKRRYPFAKISFIGRAGGKENELITNAGFELFLINISGISRKNPLKNFKVLKDAIKSKKDAKGIISSFSPDVVIGTGGYVCWPVISAAHSAGIKTVLHESNAVAGLTTRLLMNKCDLLLLSTKLNGLSGKDAIVTGIPLLNTFIPTDKVLAKARLGIPKDKKLIISVGGSIGAKKLNDSCIGIMKDYFLNDSSVYHIHSVGHRYYNEIKESEPNLCKGNERCKIVPFIKDMATALSAADVVISRCGAVTLAEISFCKTPSILIPSPNVTGNHQKKNALIFEKQGAGLMLEEHTLSPALLYKSVNDILSNENTMNAMRKNCEALSFAGSAKNIVSLIEKTMA